MQHIVRSSTLNKLRGQEDWSCGHINAKGGTRRKSALASPETQAERIKDGREESHQTRQIQSNNVRLCQNAGRDMCLSVYTYRVRVCLCCVCVCARACVRAYAPREEGECYKETNKSKIKRQTSFCLTKLKMV